MLLAQDVLDATPYVGVIGAIIMWCGFIIVLSMIKGWIVQGVSIAIGELLMKSSSPEMQEKICRWLGDKDRLLEYLRLIEEQGRSK